MGFQTQVNLTPAPAVEGDFASANPRTVVLAGPGGLVTGENGLTVGRFAWVEADFRTTNNFGNAPNVPDGFVHRDQQALITAFLGEASNVVPKGFPVTLHNTGDFWVKNLGPDALTKGAPIYAGYADGGIYSSAPAGFSGDATLGSTNTASLGATFTAAASVASDLLVITDVTGLISIGDTVAGSGILDAPTILNQVSGTVGGAGTYTLSKAETCTGGTVTCFGSVLYILVTTAGLVSIGDTVSGGAGFPVGAVITGGGAGVYTLSAPGTAYTASADAVTTFGTVLVVGTVVSGTLAPGQPIATGTGLVGLSIASQVSGTPGGVGTYTTFQAGAAYVANEAFTTVGGVGTFFAAAPTNDSDGAVGNIVKISSYYPQ